MYELKWIKEPPEKWMIDQTNLECGWLLEDGLENPGELLFHHVTLTTLKDDQPFVFVYGKEEEPNIFHCEFFEKLKREDMTTLKDKEIQMPKRE